MESVDQPIPHVVLNPQDKKKQENSQIIQSTTYVLQIVLSKLLNFLQEILGIIFRRP